MLKDRNSYGDLALHFEVSETTIQRWLKFWSPRMVPPLKIKRPSSHIHYMDKAEAERWEKAMECFWDNRELPPAKPPITAGTGKAAGTISKASGRKAYDGQTSPAHPKRRKSLSAG